MDEGDCPVKLGERLKQWLVKEEDQPPQRTTDMVEERRSMIEGIDELAETTVKEVMVPRIDVEFISDSISLNNFIAEKITLKLSDLLTGQTISKHLKFLKICELI